MVGWLLCCCFVFDEIIVSFPHYFLQASGHLAEQLKTREWIVARITSITEGVVDQKVCNTDLSFSSSSHGVLSIGPNE